MYNSQYYTCEQIDERLLQGYLDDYNEENDTNLTKAQFLSKLGSIFNVWQGLDNDPTAESDKLVKSGGVYKVNRKQSSQIESILGGGFIDFNHVISDVQYNYSYTPNNNYDALWVPVLKGSTKINITGVTTASFMYFSSFELNDNNTDIYVGSNNTGDIPSGGNVVIAIINLSKSSNQEGYGNLVISQDNPFVQKIYVDEQISQESNARQNSDNTLQQNIVAEKNRAEEAEVQLNNLITGIKNNIDNGYVYAGIATPSTVPVNGKVFYLAVTAGTYTNFGGLVVVQGVNILKYNGTAWSQEQLIGIDDGPTVESDNLVKSGGVYEINAILAQALSSEIGDYARANGYLNPIGIFGDTDKHAVISVNAGEKYIIGQNDIPESTNTVHYAFATSNAATAGGAIPFVSGTTLMSVPKGKAVVVTIPQGCSYLLFSVGPSWNARFYNYLDLIDARTAIRRYTGRTGTGYYYLYPVIIRSGSVVRNIGQGALTLYDVRNGSNSVIIRPDDTIVTTFDITWLKGRSDVDLPFELIVYDDSYIQQIRTIIEGFSVTATISTDYTFVRLPQPILKGSIIKNVSSTGGRYQVAGRTHNDVSEEAFTIIAGAVVTKDINYIRYVADTYTIEVAPMGYFQMQTRKELYNDITFSANFTAQYQQLRSGFDLLKGMIIKSILLNGSESKLYGRTTNNYYDEDALIMQAGTVLTKDINFLRNIYEAPANYTITLYCPYSLIIDRTAKVDKVQNAVHFVDGSSFTAKADTLTNGGVLSLTDYPKAARKGDNVMFSAKITSFESIKIGKGCEESYLNSWFVIDNSSVTLYYYEGGVIQVGSANHGLTISEMINVNIVYNGSVIIKVQSSDGTFEHEFSQAQSQDPATALKDYYNITNGIVKVVSQNSTLTNVSLSATNKDFKCPIWIFGASYTSVYNNQMIGQLKKIGYFDYYLHGYPGCMSDVAFANLIHALSFGTPQLLVWSIMANDASDTVWENYAQQVVDVCRQKNISLVFVNYADMKQKEFSARRQWVIDGGYRYVDLVEAVQESTYVYDTDFWYPGFMGSDGIHPTPLGANAMAMQILKDLPEIMQY